MTHPNPPAALLVVSRFRVDSAQRARFLANAAGALEALAAQPGCRAAALGQSTDDADLLVIRTQWESTGAYRRALSSFDVKVSAVPLLSQAVDEPSAYELVRDWTPAGLVEAASSLAADAGDVRLGSAAAPDVRPVTS